VSTPQGGGQNMRSVRCRVWKGKLAL